MWIIAGAFASGLAVVGVKMSLSLVNMLHLSEDSDPLRSFSTAGSISPHRPISVTNSDSIDSSESMIRLAEALGNSKNSVGSSSARRTLEVPVS